MSASGSLLGDVVRLYVAPGSLFAGFHRQRRGAAALFLLLFLHLAYGALYLSTGVPDYEVEAQTQAEIHRRADQLKGDENSEELARTVESLEKGAAFTKVFGRIIHLGGGPVRLLLGLGLISAALFFAVSLGGTVKADFSQLSAVVIFASFVEVPRLALRLYLISQLHVSRVELSAAAFLSPIQAAPWAFLLLRRLDPFELWYWTLIGLGLVKTGQLSVGRTVVLLLLLALLTAALQGCLGAGDFLEIRGEFNVEA